MYREAVTTGLVPEIVAPDLEAHRVRIALGGFLAEYSGTTRDAYALDLRQWVTWCAGHDFEVFAVRRAHIELFARSLEEEGKARSTIARRLSTITGFYRYCVEEQLLAHSPAAHVRRPKISYESNATGLTVTSLACSWFRPVSVGAGTMRWRACWR